MQLGGDICGIRSSTGLSRHNFGCPKQIFGYLTDDDVQICFRDLFITITAMCDCQWISMTAWGSDLITEPNMAIDDSDIPNKCNT